MNKTAKYISKYRNLTIAVKSAYYKVVEDKKVLVDGKRVTFQDGFFETNDENLIKELEQRPDFGTAFVRIPENKTVDQMREAMKTLSEKDKEIAALKEENERLRIKANEEGATTGKGTNDAGNAELNATEGMNRQELIARAKELDLPPATYKVGTKNADIAKAIETAENELKEEGDEAEF